MFKNLKIRYRILMALGSIVLLLAISISLTLLQISAAKENTDRIVNLRVPTALGSSSMAKDIYASLASLRGWMLTGNSNFKTKRTVIWAEITKTKASMNALSKDWTNQDNIDRWKKFTVILDKFSAAQDQVEAMAHTANERPAMKILVSEAAPRAAKMLQLITAIIDIEISGKDNKDIYDRTMMGMMADVRGTLGESLASIRAYLLTGNVQFRNEYTKQWAKNEARFTDLSRLKHLLSPGQNTAFDEFKVLRAEFFPLPLKMFDIRASKQWNMSTYLLLTEAIPRANKLLALLLGTKQEDGTFSDGMVGNQRVLLKNDNYAQIDIISKLFTMQKVLLFIGIIFSLAVSFFIARSISTPVTSITTAMKRLAAGKLDINIPALDHGDEIGNMAKALQVFKENAIERDRIEKERIKTIRELDFQKFALDQHAIVSVADVQGNITYANEKFCKISEYSLDELMGKNHSLLKSEEHLAGFFTGMWKTISRGNVWQGEIKNKKKNGGHYWVMSTIVPTLNDKGKPFQYISIRTDITERKDAEIAAMAASRTKSDLMANMSHELRTPLNAIIGFSSTMKTETFGPLSEKYMEYANDINYSGEHLLTLINDILDVSAIEAGKLELYEDNVSVSDLIEASLRIIRPRADIGKLTITSSIDDKLPTIYADKRRIKQVFLNLFSNAVKFTLEGGEVTTRSWLNSDGSLAVSIADNGIGMDDEGVRKALSTFGQVDSGLARKHEGTGLGLPLTKGLMELHGGALEVKSEKGKGSIITVTFPKYRVGQKIS